MGVLFVFSFFTYFFFFLDFGFYLDLGSPSRLGENKWLEIMYHRVTEHFPASMRPQCPCREEKRKRRGLRIS